MTNMSNFVEIVNSTTSASKPGPSVKLAPRRCTSRSYTYESNPVRRKRIKRNLLRKLNNTLSELGIRVGQQAAVLIAQKNYYHVSGTQPFVDVVKKLKPKILGDLNTELRNLTDNSKKICDNCKAENLFELPPLIVNDAKIAVEHMTQAQLRSFIPLMLKFSTKRRKIGWGREEFRPPWWPDYCPWANVRMDIRSEEAKRNASWSNVLRGVIINCYKYHRREDLLFAYSSQKEDFFEPPEENIKGEEVQVESDENNFETEEQYYEQIATDATDEEPYTLLVLDAQTSLITFPDGSTSYIQGLATLDEIDSAQIDANFGDTVTLLTNSQYEQLISSNPNISF